MSIRFLTCIAVILLCTGCAAQKRQMKAYEGPVVSPEKVALLKPYLGTILKSIDGNTAYAVTPMRAGLPNLDVDISLLPGVHVLVLGYELYGVNSYGHSVGTQTVSFEAVAGRRYLLSGHVEGDTWRAQVEDVTDTPDRWCWYEPECKGYFRSSSKEKSD